MWKNIVVVAAVVGCSVLVSEPSDFEDKIICCGYSLEAPSLEAPYGGASNEHHNICVYLEIEKLPRHNQILLGFRKVGIP